MQNINETTTTQENETMTNTETAKSTNPSFNFDPSNYGFSFATEEGEYNVGFHMDDEENWGVTFKSPKNDDARLDFEGGEGTISYADAKGDQKVEGFNFTSARKWLERFGITTTDEVEQADAE